jgi:GTP-binding protein
MKGGLPVVAVVGRPNVGKSTLVNRVIGRRDAIVEEQPGVTRDRKVVAAEWSGRSFSLVDTGGWMAAGDALDDKVSAQADRAIAEADLVLFVVDASVGVTEGDVEMAKRLRRGGAQVLVVANKVDSQQREPDMWDFVSLGLGDPLPVSALHGRASGDLLDEVIARLPTAVTDIEVDDDPTDAANAVAIVGRPNVGKSTIFNRLVGDDRSIVHDVAGTTRDTVDTVIVTEDGLIRLLDTAGMRRKSRVDEGTEYFSLVRALQAIDNSDAALLVIDATEGVTHQDQRLAERIDAAGSPIVIVVNKWEMLDAEQRADVLGQVGDRLAFLAYAPVLKISARTGLGVHRLLPALRDSIEAYHRRVPTRELNTVIAAAQAAHPSPTGRVLYATQGATDPPTFTLFATKAIAPTYLRYLEHQIRDKFDFGPTPLKLRVRKRG